MMTFPDSTLCSHTTIVWTLEQRRSRILHFFPILLSSELWNNDVPGFYTLFPYYYRLNFGMTTFLGCIRRSKLLSKLRNDDIPESYSNMYKMCIVKPSPFQWLVTTNLAQWKVITRTVPGQEYHWVAINSKEPLIGPAPPLISSENDWLTTVDHWSRDRPYRVYIPLNLANNVNFPMGHWVSDWVVSDCRGHWSLTSRMRQTIFSIREDSWEVVQTLISTSKLMYTFPLQLSLRWLSDHFNTPEALAAKVAEARHHLLEQYGLIAHYIKRRPDWITHPELSTSVWSSWPHCTGVSGPFFICHCLAMRGHVWWTL